MQLNTSRPPAAPPSRESLNGFLLFFVRPPGERSSQQSGELIGLTFYKNYGDGYKFHVSTPKTDAGIRKIPMGETVYKVFAAQKRQNFLQRIPRNVEIEGRTDFIFMRKNGRPLMPSAVNNVHYNLVAAYNKQETEQAKKEKPP